MRIMRRVFTFVVALCFMSSLCLPALADTWDLNEGSVSVDFRPNEQQQVVQHVTQGENSKPDSNPTITSHGKETSNTITVSSSEGQTAQVTIENVKINTERDNSAIDITAGSSAVITVQGDKNAVDNTQTAGTDGNKAAIHVGDGASLTIQGSDTPPSGEDNKLLVNVENLKYDITGAAAGIGSNAGENFTGNVTITGDVYVESQSANRGAAIGAGNKGDFNGTVNITDGADVHVEGSANSTGIGAGNGGDFNGSVNIADSTVYADTYSNGAGIGAGMNGDFNGKVEINNSDVTAISGPGGNGEGAGIGAGYNGNFSGIVNITDSTVLAKATNDGAGIGAGGTDSNSPSATEFTAQGQVNIHNSKVTADTRSQGIPIGAPESTDLGSKYNGIFNGTVNITGNSEVTLIDVRNTELGEQVLIGGADGNSSGNVNIDDTAKVTYWAGIGEDKGEIDNGSFSTATPEQYDQIIQGAEIEIVAVAKAAGAKVPVYRFWDDVEAKIKAADKGDTITIDVKDRTTIPTRILELVAEYGVTLIIQWNGGDDIIVPPDHGVEVDAETILLTELITLLKK